MLAILDKYPSFEFIKSIGWEEIFNVWRQGEASQKSWKKHWEERGFSSWDEWRKAYAKPIGPESLEWFLYKIKNPLQEFPSIYGTPTKSWVEKAYGGETTKQLKDILKLPIISENPKIVDIKKDFPKETMLTGLLQKNRIVLIEGMHRACALASWEKPKPPKSQITIALACWKEKEIPIIGGNFKGK